MGEAGRKGTASCAHTPKTFCGCFPLCGVDLGFHSTKSHRDYIRECHTQEEREHDICCHNVCPTQGECEMDIRFHCNILCLTQGRYKMDIRLCFHSSCPTQGGCKMDIMICCHSLMSYKGGVRWTFFRAATAIYFHLGEGGIL